MCPLHFRTAQNYLARFRERAILTYDSSRSGRPILFDEERLTTLQKEENRQTSSGLAK